MYQIKGLIGVVLISLLSLSCNKKEKISQKPMVLASTAMIADAVYQLVDTSCNIEMIIPSGMSPHSYVATHDDLYKFQMASIVFYNGLHLEGKLEESFIKIPNAKAVTASIPKNELITYEANAYDPHIWLDVVLWKKAVHEIAIQLQKQFPELKDKIVLNEKSYLAKLSILNNEIVSKIAEIPVNQRVLITSHEAFGYFGKRYGLQVMGLQGVNDQNEASLQHVETLASTIASQKIKTIFSESAISDKGIQSLLHSCDERGAKVTLGKTLFSETMGAAGTPQFTYLGMMQYNISTLNEALK